MTTSNSTSTTPSMTLDDNRTTIMNASPTEPLLSARQLKKSYGCQPLLAIDSLELHAGEATLLTGRNGAGKSTLLKMLAGLEDSDSGSLSYRGVTLTRRQHHNIGGRVIYLHQQPFLFDGTVEKNIGYGLRQLNRSQRQQRVKQALEWSGLGHLSERNANTLSGGERQRVALARAWVMQPELLLMDEPTTNMDTESRQQTLFLIRRLINEGKSIVLSSHEFKGDHRLFQRQWHIDAGQLSEQRFEQPAAGSQSPPYSPAPNRPRDEHRSQL